MTNAAALPTIKSAWARATGHLEIDLPVASLPNLLLAAVSRAPQYTIADLQPNGATVSTGVSAFSWGSKITVQFSATSETTSALDARLAPLIATNVLDFGQSKRDLTHFLTTVAAVIPR